MIFRLPTRAGRLPSDLSALADDSIPSDRRRRIERQLEASEELRTAFHQERLAVELLREARERDRAPASLRLRVAELRVAHSRSAPWHARLGGILWRPHAAAPLRRAGALASGLAAAGAVAGVTAVLLLTGGAVAGPSVAQAASLAFRGADASGPAVNPSDPNALMDGVGEVYFPNWHRTLGWSTIGRRVDRLDHHLAATVYYGWHGQSIAYTIVSVPALAEPRAAGVVTAAGLRVRVLSLAGRHVVTWRRNGQTCVLSSRNVSAGELESLAGWS